MKTKLLLLPVVLQAVFLLSGLPGQALAQETPPAAHPDTAQLLREALFEEQGVRDLEKAAADYQKVIAAYDAERAFGATALYRLAEVRRAQNKKDEAASLYQRLLTEFPTHDPLARLSRENLAALGVKALPGADPAVADEQDARIAELKRMLKDSPDRVTGQVDNSPLLQAVEKGQTRVVRFLLEAGAKLTEWVLPAAAENGHLSICELLIAHGANVKTKGPLESAVSRGHTEVVRLLLAKGAPPNETLFESVQAGYTEITDLLIEAKANPNLPPPGRSPLYYAVRNGNVPVAKRLLAIGADVRVRCIDSLVPRLGGIYQGGIAARQVIDSERDQKEYNSTAAPVGWPLLHAAVLSDRLEMLDLLLPLIKNLEDPGHSGQQTALALAVGAKQVEMAEHLLKAGASAKVNGSGGLPLLFVAADNMNERLVKLLLAAGADASYVAPDGRTVLASLVRSGEKALPLIRLLIAAGADLEKEWATGPMAVQLAREFRYPKLALPDQVTLSLPESGAFLPLMRKASGSKEIAPSLTDLMLEASIRWLDIYPPEWNKAHLYRRNAEGQLEQQIISDWSEENPPILQWGDIVEFVSANWETPAPPNNLEYKQNLPTEIQSRLRASLVRQVTVNLDGKSYPITLRGALKVYNPLKPEAPLTDAVTLMKMMGGDDLRWYHASIRVKRLPEQGGGEISSKITGGSIIPLQEGDILELTGDPVTWQRNGSGISVVGPPTMGISNSSTDIVLLSPDLPFSKVVKNSPFSAPTLIQFLAAAYPPLSSGSLAKPATGGRIGSLSELTAHNAAQSLTDQYLQSLLPHPDWSQIKIRRVSDNKEVLEISVNLADAIAAFTDATTAEEARKADLELLPGDTVLLPIRQDQKDQPWTGWDAATIRFFSKALAMQVTLADADGSFRALNLEYLPVRYVETPAGLLGLAAREPAQHLLTAFSTPALLDAAAPGKPFSWLQRANSTDRTGAENPIPGPDKWFWLRDKDTVGIAAPPRRATPPLPLTPGQ